MARDGRDFHQLRQVSFTLGFQEYPLGSVLVEMGRTRVALGVWAEEKVAHWLAGSGRGWVTAEYSMLPGATHRRSFREASTGKVGGRTHEIQRLVGRSLRAAVDLKVLEERSLRVDCDVLQADAGTRCASICGGYVALVLACRNLMAKGVLKKNPVMRPVTAVSCAVVNGQVVLDPDYAEDHKADADLNFVFAGEELDLVEVQGTAEGLPFSREKLSQALDLAQEGARALLENQRQALGGELL